MVPSSFHIMDGWMVQHAPLFDHRDAYLHTFSITAGSKITVILALVMGLS